MNPRSFGSDNNATVSPEVLQAIGDANVGQYVAYGDDPWTDRALKLFKAEFGPESETYFVFNGTAANILALRPYLDVHHAVVCSALSHMHEDECGAPERILGSKLLLVPPRNGKITPAGIQPLLQFGSHRAVQPRVISVSQTTELGTIYNPDELRSLAELAHAHGMYLHVDGARLANAAAALGVSLRALTADVGVDSLSFGGTKNGLLAGEAVVLLRPRTEREKAMGYYRKQSMQLASKMRFTSAQFEAFLRDGLWLRNARHANAMARELEAAVRAIPSVRVLQPVDSNMLFVRLPKAKALAAQAKHFFYIMNEDPSEPGTCDARWVTSWDTRLEDIRSFVAALSG